MLKIGDKAPNFLLEAANYGKDVQLTDFRGKSVVLFFYPKDETPGCIKEVCSLRDNYQAIVSLNAVILGINGDSVESHQSFSNNHNLTFPLLSDEDHKIATEYGVWKEKKFLGKVTMGIERTTFIIDKEGFISNVFSNVKPNGHGEEVYEYLKQLHELEEV
ncbi:thioredoxin-dependent thiol peroxidase [Priestia koreensis]|uniref:thioredoxin-dependent thiol peroxidase n=1 Tax=Priestia koreensis TaxID=284581 RepID=UPI003D08E4E0